MSFFGGLFKSRAERQAETNIADACVGRELAFLMQRSFARSHEFCDRGSLPISSDQSSIEREFERARQFVLDAFSVKDYVLFEDAVSESGEARDIVHRAFTDLVDAGGYRMRWIEGAGMVVERVVG